MFIIILIINSIDIHILLLAKDVNHDSINMQFKIIIYNRYIYYIYIYTSHAIYLPGNGSAAPAIDNPAHEESSVSAPP